ncbi:type II secretion system protein GspD [Vibrio maritimus]|uniref:type II secretion system protein GspD n=1 Tax=Vibrio maritimus TaxID=990268 RepID=UPI001F44FC57|nr:hypothetical protein [Vibrio maritimus]
MKKTLIMSLLLTLTVVGCASQEYEDIKTYHESISQEITDKTTFEKPKKVTRIKKPPQRFSPIEAPIEMTWLDDPITVNARQMPFSVVLEEIMAGVDVPLFFAENVDPNKAATLNFSSSRRNVLNALSRDVGFGISASEGRLDITATITKTFSVNLPTGKMDAQIGSQGTAGEQEGRIEGQYLNISYQEVDLISDIANDIVNLLGGDESASHAVSASTYMSAVTVTTTPDKMMAVENLVEHYQKELSKQVLLDVRVVEFYSDVGTERGIDWNLVYESGDGILEFFVPGTNTLSQEAGYGFAFQGKGKWSGTEALIKVLEKQGSVSSETPITALVLNHQPARITQQRVVPFLDEVNSDSTENTVSTGVTRDEKMEGVDFMVSAKVQPDHVWLRTSGLLNRITKNESREVAGVDLGFLTTQKSEITFANKLRYGQTYVLASVKQQTKTAEETKNFFSRLFGGTGTKNETIETLVLLTPRKVQ